MCLAPFVYNLMDCESRSDFFEEAKNTHLRSFARVATSQIKALHHVTKLILKVLVALRH